MNGTSQYHHYRIIGFLDVYPGGAAYCHGCKLACIRPDSMCVSRVAFTLCLRKAKNAAPDVLIFGQIQIELSLTER